MAEITIADATPRVQYTVGGSATTGPWTIPWPYYETGDIKVYFDDTLKTISSHYTISGTAVDDGFSGGTVSATSSQSNITVTIVRDIPVARTTDFPVGPFNVKTLNKDLDKLYAIGQQAEENFSRKVGRSATDTATFSLDLPTSTSTAKTLMLDSSNGMTLGATTAENVKRRALEFLKGYQGGSVKLVRDYILAADAEELLGEGLGMRASGFPMTKKDALFSLSGIRSQTVLPEKAIGYKTFNDLKAIGEVDSMFYDELRKLPIKQITPEDIDNIVDRYKELQLRKVKGLSDFNKNIDLYSKFSYTRKFLNKNNKPDTEKLTLGTAGVLKAVTNNYAYNTAPEVERAFANQALQDSKQELFVPKDIDTDKLQKFVQERSNDVGIVGDLIVKLQNVNKELINTTLNPKGEE